MMDWRKIETILVEWFKAECECDIRDQGDKIAVLGCNDDHLAHQINLTSLAKTLANELDWGK